MSHQEEKADQWVCPTDCLLALRMSWTRMKGLEGGIFILALGEGFRHPGTVTLGQEAGCACDVEISSELGERKPSPGVTG